MSHVASSTGPSLASFFGANRSPLKRTKVIHKSGKQGSVSWN